MEDLLRRERIVYPHTQFYSWRTQVGAEVDLLLGRGSDLYAVEIKTARGVKPSMIKKLEEAMDDIRAKWGWLVIKETLQVRLSPRIERRGFVSTLNGLPEYSPHRDFSKAGM